MYRYAYSREDIVYSLNLWLQQLYYSLKPKLDILPHLILSWNLLFAELMFSEPSTWTIVHQNVKSLWVKLYSLILHLIFIVLSLLLVQQFSFNKLFNIITFFSIPGWLLIMLSHWSENYHTLKCWSRTGNFLMFCGYPIQWLISLE